MPEPLPKAVQFRKRHRDVWNAFNELGESCHQAGPLDEKTRRVVKLALSIGAGLEGATHSAVRNARKSDVSTEEMEHVALLSITTLWASGCDTGLDMDCRRSANAEAQITKSAIRQRDAGRSLPVHEVHLK